MPKTNFEIENKSYREVGNALGLEDVNHNSYAPPDFPILLSQSKLPQRRLLDNYVMATGWVQNQLGDYHYVEHGRIEEVSESSLRPTALQSSRTGNNVFHALSPSTTPPPCPKPKLPDLPIELEYAADSADDISLHKLMADIESAQIEITALADVSKHTYGPRIQLLSRISQLLCLALSEVLRAVRLRYDITEDEWSCADDVWCRKYDQRLSSLQRSIQRLRQAAGIICRRFDKILPIIEKFRQHYLKLINVAGQFSSGFVKLKTRYHYKLMQDLDLQFEQDENLPDSREMTSQNSNTKRHRRHNPILRPL